MSHSATPGADTPVLNQNCTPRCLTRGRGPPPKKQNTVSGLERAGGQVSAVEIQGERDGRLVSARAGAGGSALSSSPALLCTFSGHAGPLLWFRVTRLGDTCRTSCTHWARPASSGSCGTPRRALQNEGLSLRLARTPGQRRRSWRRPEGLQALEDTRHLWCRRQVCWCRVFGGPVSPPGQLYMSLQVPPPYRWGTRAPEGCYWWNCVLQNVKLKSQQPGGPEKATISRKAFTEVMARRPLGRTCAIRCWCPYNRERKTHRDPRGIYPESGSM